MTTVHPPVRIDAVLIESPSPEALAAFYQEGFALDPARRYADDHVGLTLPGGGYLGFDLVSAPPATPGRTQIWFRVADVAATYTRLLELGATSRTAPDAMDGSDDELLAMLHDPEGNTIGLVGPRA